MAFLSLRRSPILSRGKLDDWQHAMQPTHLLLLNENLTQELPSPFWEAEKQDGAKLKGKKRCPVQIWQGLLFALIVSKASSSYSRSCTGNIF
jgi:hypothetical protein